jgi:PAS domain-containing protein
VASLLSLMSRVGAPSFAEADLQLLGRFMPHLQRAITIHRRLEGADLARTAASEALDCLAIGVVILDSDGKVLFLNTQTQTLLTRGDGLLLQRDGLSAVNATDAAALRRLVADACATGVGRGVLAGGPLHITRRPPLRPLSVLVAPLRVRSFALSGPSPAAIVFIGDPERTSRGSATCSGACTGSRRPKPP